MNVAAEHSHNTGHSIFLQQMGFRLPIELGTKAIQIWEAKLHKFGGKTKSSIMVTTPSQLHPRVLAVSRRTAAVRRTTGP